MKRVFAIILTITILFGICVNVVASDTDGVIVSATSVSGKDDETISISVSVLGNTGTTENDGICAYEIELSYDSDYLSAVTDDGFTKGAAAFDVVECNSDKTSGDFKAIAVSGVAANNIKGDAALFSHKFNIKNNSGQETTTMVNISLCKLYYLNDGVVTSRVSSVENATVTINPAPTPTPGGTGGGGSVIQDKPTTTTNPDGSKTTSVTDKKTGTTTQTTEYTDGAKTVVETKKDGTVTTTKTDVNGNKGQTVVNPDGKTTTVATISKESVANASENGTIVCLPIESVASKKDADDAHPVSVILQTESVQDNNIKVKIPVTDVKSNTVAVIVNEDGSTQIIRKTVLHEDGLVVVLDSSKTLKIIENSKTFEDTKDHWGEEYVEFVTSRELFNGTSQTTFEPDAFMTRAMITRVLHNYESNPEHSFDGSFADVDDGEWYSDSVLWAAQHGIVKGYEDGSFGVDGNMTREDLAVILYRYAGAPSHVSAGIGIFSDVDKISDYATDALSWAVEKGIMSGIGNNKLDPKGEATRAQVAAMLQRFALASINGL